MNRILCLLLFAMIYLVACKKNNDSTPDVPKVQSITSILGPMGYAMNFTYTGELLSGFSYPYKGGADFSVNYDSKGRIGNVVASYYFLGTFKMASAIFTYGTNENVSRVSYKTTGGGRNASDPYFGDLSDGKLQTAYDSLTYGTNNRIESIYSMDAGIVTGLVQFSYDDTHPDVPVKLEQFRNNAGQLTLDDKIELTTNDMNSPFNTLWFFPYMDKISYMVGSSMGVDLPILFDDPSTYLDYYLPYVKKCITNYKVYNNWGFYNYKNTIFNYYYASDGKRFTARKQGGTDSVNIILR
ncbi:hypothetical protein [Chitinophaga sp. Cy-1792]|uniref:hypothetical protein n=1 Tax=Chitinophaga sp. Cy-1792 TaxID=2608339 RepID=UPI0014243498|nr:hypothetical protein [Chitinophaga sp. Cy-1792]NIG55736.1 hypothetical protein [Chitinophaga sp. Cy-1792]